MALPSVLFSSSIDKFKPQEFVKYVLKVSELPQPKVITDNIESYEWSFETKYYSTTVQLCATNKRTIGDKQFAESVQAFIHFFDPNEPSSFELAKAWLPYLRHMEPDILMLVCNTSHNSDAVTRKDVLEWCVQNAFELVELNPDQDSEDDDFPETTGIARIVQALHAHIWPNLDMKNSPTVQSSCTRYMMEEQYMLNKQHQILKSSLCIQDSSESSQLSAHSSNDDNVHILTKDREAGEANFSKLTNDTPFKESYQVDSDRINKTSASASAEEKIFYLDGKALKTLQTENSKADKKVPLTDSHPDVEEFEELFMKLKFMKDEAEKLPPEQRKRYAEQVAISFWKTIGGDDNEIDGVDEDSD